MDIFLAFAVATVIAGVCYWSGASDHWTIGLALVTYGSITILLGETL